MACAPAALVPAPASAHALALAPALSGTFPEETFTLTPTPATAPAPALALSPALLSALGSVYTLTCYWHFWCLHSRTFALAPSPAAGMSVDYAFANYLQVSSSVATYCPFSRRHAWVHCGCIQWFLVIKKRYHYGKKCQGFGEFGLRNNLSQGLGTAS